MSIIYYYCNPLFTDEKTVQAIFDYMPQERQIKYSKGIKAYRYEGIVCYALLMLAKYRKNESFQDIRFSYSEREKPYTDGMHFNFSHCEECCVCAVSEKNIGVDVQKKDNVSKSVIDRYCTKNEADMLENGMPFRRLWTQKEAIVKYTGMGIEQLNRLQDLSCYENDGMAYSTAYGFLYTDKIGECSVSVCSEEQETELVEVTQRDIDEMLGLLT